MLACIFRLSLHARILLFPFQACRRIPVTSTPTATSPINRFSTDLSYHSHKIVVLTVFVSFNDASSVLHSRSALRHLADSLYTAFSYLLSTTAFDCSTNKCFTISTCIAIVEGLPPSQKEHC